MTRSLGAAWWCLPPRAGARRGESKLGPQAPNGGVLEPNQGGKFFPVRKIRVWLHCVNSSYDPSH